LKTGGKGGGVFQGDETVALPWIEGFREGGEESRETFLRKGRMKVWEGRNGQKT